jgi:cytoskeletal protein RodZ
MRDVVASEAGNGYLCLVATVGEQLRLAREAQKMEVHEVADMTKIRGDHIRALEAGNYSVFSAPVYIRGFVRTYAGLLHLNVQQVLEQLGAELADSGQIDPSLAPAKRGILDRAMFQLSQGGRRLLVPATMVVLALLVLLAAYFVARHSRGSDPTAGLGEDFYQSPTNSGDTLPLPPLR